MKILSKAVIIPPVRMLAFYLFFLKYVSHSNIRIKKCIFQCMSIFRVQCLGNVDLNNITGCLVELLSLA